MAGRMDHFELQRANRYDFPIAKQMIRPGRGDGKIEWQAVRSGLLDILGIQRMDVKESAGLLLESMNIGDIDLAKNIASKKSMGAPGNLCLNAYTKRIQNAHL